MNRSSEGVEGNPAAPGNRQHHGEQDRCRRVDRHRNRDAVERNIFEERLHIGDAIDGDADLSDFAARLPGVGVVPELRRKIERNATARSARVPAGSGSAHWIRRPSRNPHIDASSTGARDTCRCECRGRKGNIAGRYPNRAASLRCSNRTFEAGFRFRSSLVPCADLHSPRGAGLPGG